MRIQKWHNEVEIWHTCRLDEYMGIAFFIFSKSSFLDLWDPFSSKPLGQHREVKNGSMLKFIKLMDWMI